MDAIINSGQFTLAQIRQLNYCRLYLKAVTLSDLSTPAGVALDRGKLDDGSPSVYSSSRTGGSSIYQVRPLNSNGNGGNGRINYGVPRLVNCMNPSAIGLSLARNSANSILVIGRPIGYGFELMINMWSAFPRWITAAIVNLSILPLGTNWQPAIVLRLMCSWPNRGCGSY